MDYDTNKVDEMALSLMHLTTFGEKQGGVVYFRSWKSLDWDILNRLHEKGYISNPVGKAKSVGMTDEGEKLSRELFEKFFGK